MDPVTPTDAVFLASLPEGSLEARYHAELLALVRAIDRLTDPRLAGEAGGLGLLALVSGGRIATAGFDSDASPVGGSIEEAAVLVAHVYADVALDRLVWKSRLPARAGDADVQAALDAWTIALRGVPGVLEVTRA